MSIKNPDYVYHASAVKKRDHEKFVGGFALSCLLGFWESQHASTGNSVSWSLGHNNRSSFHRRSLGHQELLNLELLSSSISLLSWKRLSFWSSLSTLGINFAQIFRIFSFSRIIVWTVPTLTTNFALIISIDTQRSLSMKFFILPNNSGVLTSLLLPHLSSSLTDSLSSLNHLCHSKTDARFMQVAPKAVWSILYVSVAFFQV